jgi:aerobic-type carbon monoxide dehydrogenase small subunit (CoxS/CutS family)
MTEHINVQLSVNGAPRELNVEPRKTLADALREDLGLTGTHLGCEHGVCGACTILLNGEAVRSCILLAVQARNAEVQTIEGLQQNGEMHPMQQAFRESHSFQCGFCTPGFVMSTVGFLAESSSPTEQEIREALSGNICRCTGYQSIVEGVQRAAELTAMKGA